MVSAMAAAAPTLDQAFHALADPSRRTILSRLSRGPASVSELAEPLPMSLPAVTQHLDMLRESGLVRTEKVGRVRQCRLDAARLGAVEQWIARHRTAWETRLDELGDVLDDTYGRSTKP
jgi:DNA-binding transcriptional ArsR family regulator